MIELSIEEKAKRYDEAIERAEKLYKDAITLQLEQDMKDYEFIFPELAESEDERIRGAIIDHLKDNNLIEWAAWLEKQGESDETKAKTFLINKGYPIDTNSVFPTYEEMYNIIREGLEKQSGEKVSSAWSEEDERNLQGVIDEIEANKNQAPDYDLAAYDRFLSWLKALKDRVKPQWKPSEEQMKLLREVQQALLGKDCHNRFVNFMYELKRLKEK